MNVRRYLLAAAIFAALALGFFGRGCLPSVPTFTPPYATEKTHTVTVRTDTVKVFVPKVQVERLAGTEIHDTVTGETSCVFHAVEKGDTIDARVTDCVLDYLIVSQPPVLIETRDSIIRDSITKEHFQTWGLSAFVETNILHGISLPDAIIGADGTFSVANLSLYVQPQFGVSTGFAIYAGVTCQIR